MVESAKISFLKSRPGLGLLLTSGLVSCLACGSEDQGQSPLDAAPTLIPSDAGIDLHTPDDLDGDSWPNGGDNCPSLPNPEQRDRDRDGLGDDCDACPATPSGPGQPAPESCIRTVEREPNDALDQAQPFVLSPEGSAGVLLGTIEAPSRDGLQGLDRFEVMVAAGTLLKIRVARANALSQLEPGLTVMGGGLTAPREAENLFVAEREVYLAAAGTYMIAIGDRRGLFGDDARGGDAYAYELSLWSSAVVAEPVSVPTMAVPVSFDPPGRVRVFSANLSPSGRARILAETTLGPEEIGSIQDSREGIDPILVVERGDGTIEENDNLGPGTLDALLLFPVGVEGAVRIVLDHVRIFGTASSEVRLSIDQPRDDEEVEPNGRLSLASPLLFPGETEGEIDEPAASGPDEDWYSFLGSAGQVATFYGLVQPSSQVDPELVLGRVVAGEFEALYRNSTASGISARIEAILPEPGIYALLVVDERNKIPPYRGGGGLFRYLIVGEPSPLRPQSEITATSTLSGTLHQGGSLARHLATVAQPMVLELDALSVGHEDLTPSLRVYGPGAIRILGQGTRSAAAFLPVAGSYVVAIHNENAGLGGPGFSYEIGARLVGRARTDESEPNDEAQTSQVLGPLPQVVGGTLSSAADLDGYAFTSSAGAVLDALLVEGERDRTIEILFNGTTNVARAEGSLRGYELALTGTYHARVSSPTRGTYTLILRTRR